MGRKRRKQPQKLAQKLKEARKRLDLGQKEMAQVLQRIDENVYPGLISRFEHGLAEPSLLVLLEYSRLLGVSMETFVNDKLKFLK
jgi:transcriptional regulator with XRE-family HTH domain